MSGDPLRDLDCAPSWARNRIPVSMIKELSVDCEVKGMLPSAEGFAQWLLSVAKGRAWSAR